MQTREELYDLLEYSDYEKRDRHYFGGETPAVAISACEIVTRSATLPCQC